MSVSGMPLEMVRDMGWTLIHFLWQGLLLAALLNAILPFCRSAVARHNCALATLLIMAWTPVATFAFLHNAGRNAEAVLSAKAAVSALSLPAPWMNALVLLWIAGIAVMSMRALGGWYLVQSQARCDTHALPEEFLQRCRQLQRRLAVITPVRFVLSQRIQVPMVIGWLRPVILIPVAALAGLPPRQLDALILHELAHIRRLDTVTNILLIALETILFYHPAVWWLARQVRIEREHCCDDFAVRTCGDVTAYVEALTSLEHWKAAGTHALAANGGKLKSRVARLLEPTTQSRRISLSALTGLALLGLIAASVAVAQAQKPAFSGTYASNDKKQLALRPIMETHQLPPYPKESITLKEEGRVLVNVTIGADGTVSRAEVVGPSGHQRLDSAAANFVKGYWRWHPLTRAGKPVTANTRVSVLFKLASKSSPPVRR